MEHNPSLAIVVLHTCQFLFLRLSSSFQDRKAEISEDLVKAGKTRFDSLLQSMLVSLVEKPTYVSLHSMEVVNKVCMDTKSAKDFIYLHQTNMTHEQEGDLECGANVVEFQETAARLPPLFLRTYMIQLIANTLTLQDKYEQHRFARLVCVFLTSIVRHCSDPRIAKRLNLFDDDTHEAVLPSIQSLCIAFSSMEAAAQLFRLVKSRPANHHPTDTKAR